jgi:competence protein ComEC
MRFWKCMFVAAAAIASASFGAGAAWADDVVIQRNVTVREGPARRTHAITFPAIGTRLDLLDEGATRNGYYHVRLPDGREGWVYRTFVRRVSDAEALVAPPLVGSAAPGDRMRVHYINVEQGNAALLEFPCGAVLIDAGGRERLASASQHLLDYLTAFFARRPDLNKHLAAVFITHTHSDHNSNLRMVAEAFTVDNYIHNGLRTGSGRVNANWMPDHGGLPAGHIEAVQDVGTAPVTDAVIDSVACARVNPKIEVLSGGLTVNPGWGADDFKNGNNHSLVIRVDYGAASFLFPGDLENAGIARLATRLANPSELDVDVLEVNHHGAANGTTAAWLSLLTPKMAVISMGPATVQEPWTGWAYGHPRKAVIDLLQASLVMSRPPVMEPVGDGAKAFTSRPITRAIYATGWDGDVVVTAAPDGTLSVSASRGQ